MTAEKDVQVARKKGRGGGPPAWEFFPHNPVFLWESVTNIFLPKEVITHGWQRGGGYNLHWRSTGPMSMVLVWMADEELAFIGFLRQWQKQLSIFTQTSFIQTKLQGITTTQHFFSKKKGGLILFHPQSVYHNNSRWYIIEGRALHTIYILWSALLDQYLIGKWMKWFFWTKEIVSG